MKAFKIVGAIFLILIVLLYGAHMGAQIRFLENSKFSKTIKGIENNIYNYLYNKAMEFEEKEKVKKEENRKNAKPPINVNFDKIKEVKLVKKYDVDTVVDEMDTVNFGSYYKNSSVNKEPLQWIVLDRKFGKALLMSKDIIDVQTYNSNGDDRSWENSNIRHWLNNDFINIAFSEEDKKKIVETNVKGDELKERSTKDKVYILSTPEMNNYFYNIEGLLESVNCRKANQTPYASSKGSVNGYWTRTEYQSDKLDGIWLNGGPAFQFTNKTFGVRPVIWIKY